MDKKKKRTKAYLRLGAVRRTITFQNTEEKMLKTLRKILEKEPDTMFIGRRNFCRRAGIASTTLYRHHASVEDMFRRHKEQNLEKFRAILRRSRSALSSPGEAYYCTLNFIQKNSDFFAIIFLKNDSDFIYKMFDALRSEIYKTVNFPQGSEKTFRMFVAEVYTLLEDWQKTEFSDDKLKEVKHDIDFLAKTARKRLFPLDG